MGPNLHYLQGSSCCPGHEERESPRDLFEMVLGHFPSWRESRSSGHGGARKQLVTSRPPCQHPSWCPGMEPPKSTGSIPHPTPPPVTSFLSLNKGGGKSECERKEKRRCFSGRVSQALESGTRVRLGCCFCSCLTQLVGQTVLTPRVPLLPRVKKIRHIKQSPGAGCLPL